MNPHVTRHGLGYMGVNAVCVTRSGYKFDLWLGPTVSVPLLLLYVYALCVSVSCLGLLLCCPL